jgi:hypothetical protein
VPFRLQFQNAFKTDYPFWATQLLSFFPPIGRGSSDMKSGLAAMIHAAAAARDEGLLTSGRIGIVLVPDEGTAGPRGSRDLNARGVLGKEGIGKITQSGAQLESMMVVFSVPAAKLTIGSKATRSIPRAR